MTTFDASGEGVPRSLVPTWSESHGCAHSGELHQVIVTSCVNKELPKLQGEGRRLEGRVLSGTPTAAFQVCLYLSQMPLWLAQDWSSHPNNTCYKWWNP